jgi:hypothetical protein
MRHIHRHSSFPLVVILLSLGLIVLMFYAFTGEPTIEEEVIDQSESEEVIEISTDDYRSDIASVTSTFYTEYSAADDDLEKLLIAEDLLGLLLEMHVPTEYKDLHLNLAVIFSQLESGLRSPDRSVDDPLRELGLLQIEYPWLAE